MKAKIAYRFEQSTNANSSFSQSASKPAKLMAKVVSLGLSTELLKFEPTSRKMLAETHDAAFVNGVLDRKINNGFGNRLKALVATFPYTTGSSVAVALEAFRTKERVLSPTSGFHHAHYDRGGAYCTFNGLIGAAQELRKVGAGKVAIIDLDQHAGDGTAALLAKHKLADFVRHYTFGAGHVPTPKPGWKNFLIFCGLPTPTFG